MSRGQLQRTPENFPRMKHRAAGRIARKKAERTAKVIAPSVIDALGEALREIGWQFSKLVATMRAAFVPPLSQDEFALVPARPSGWLQVSDDVFRVQREQNISYSEAERVAAASARVRAEVLRRTETNR